MDLSYHLARQTSGLTSGLTRAINHDTRGISYVLAAIMIFNIILIIFEISVVCGI